MLSKNMLSPYRKLSLFTKLLLCTLNLASQESSNTENILVERYGTYGGSTTYYIDEHFVAKHGKDYPYIPDDTSRISILSLQKSTGLTINLVTCDSSYYNLSLPHSRYSEAFTFVVLNSRAVLSREYFTITEFQVALEQRANPQQWTEYLKQDRLTIHVASLTEKGNRFKKAFKSVFAEAPPELQTPGYIVSYTVDNVENAVPIAKTYRLTSTDISFLEYVQRLSNCNGEWID